MNSSNICIYTSAGCNRSPNTLDWGGNGFICYSACNAIHLWKYKENGRFDYFQNLLGHKKVVTSVHFIKGNNTEAELISTSADCTAVIWTQKDNKFLKTSTLAGHTSIVRNASGIYFAEDGSRGLLVATLSTDSTLKIWRRLDQAECTQSISFGNGFGLDVKFSLLNNELILLVGADDSKIHIYTQDESNMFNRVLSLEGHENWIQSLDVIHKDEKTLMVVSASEDCYLRIWKIVSKEINVEETIAGILKVDEAKFSTNKGHTYSVFVESILSGHENWIYSVRWHWQQNKSLQILSTSMDKTMIIWEVDPQSNIWTEKVWF